MNTRTWSFVLLAAATAWVVFLLAVGTMAAIIFPTMKHLDPLLPEYSKVPESHWTLAAGLVMRQMFFIGDVLQVVLLLISTLAMLMVWKGFGLNHVQRWIMAVPLAVGAVVVLTSGLWLAPGMRADIDQALVAAKAGDAKTCQECRARFAAKHPASETLMGIALVSALGVWASAFAFAKPRSAS